MRRPSAPARPGSGPPPAEHLFPKSPQKSDCLGLPHSKNRRVCLLFMGRVAHSFAFFANDCLPGRSRLTLTSSVILNDHCLGGIHVALRRKFPSTQNSITLAIALPPHSPPACIMQATTISLLTTTP